MEDTTMGLSSKSLVSGNRASKLPQYLAALSATLGGFVMGTVLGWTSPTQGPLTNGTDTNYDFAVSSSDFSLIGALSAVGAMVGSIVTGPISDMFGRKRTMISLIVPSCVGWAIMIWATNVVMMQVGRFLTGFVGGAMSVVGPLYTTEIAQVEIRGTLGTFFQLQVTLGILFTYILGAAFVPVFWLSVACAIIPFIFIGAMFLQPESPQYYLQNNNKEEAKKSLQRLRGKAYDTSGEIAAMQDAIDKMRAEKVSLSKAFTTKAAIKGLIIGLGVMFLQQFSGINAVVFYSTNIFNAAGSSLAPELSTLIVGLVMFLLTCVSSLIVDRLGRKPLLLLSDLIMAIAAAVLGVFFCLKSNGTDVNSIGWLPLLCVCIFIIMFSIGFGPIPWMFMSEIFPPGIKGAACSVASLFNWICVFLITYFFSSVVDAIGQDFAFWIFAIISACGVVFIWFIVPETKGKSLEEIQRVLGGSSNGSQQSISTVEAGDKTRF